MIMKKTCLWCGAAALAAVLAACSVNLVPQTDYTEPRTFDLASPGAIGTLPFIVEVDAFANECSGRFKMVFREEGNRISVDEYNRWSMAPGAMLTKYLAARFAAPSDNQNRTKKPVFELDGSVLNCELNRSTKQVSLMVHYFIILHGDDNFRITGTEDYTIPVKEDTAEAFADGISQAAAKFSDHVVNILTKELQTRSAETQTEKK